VAFGEPGGPFKLNRGYPGRCPDRGAERESSAAPPATGQVRDARSFAAEAGSSQEAQPIAAPEAAVETWENEGGAAEQVKTVARNPIDEEAPRFLEAYVGSFNGFSYGVCWDGTTLVYESFEPGYQRRQQLLLNPSQAQWRRFWRSMDQLAVWEWGKRYEPGERFEPENVVRDGTYWSLTLVHGGRAVESSGDNSGPDARDLDESSAFAGFCEAIARLTGGCEFA
jgi:hypothetical protein